MTTPARYSEQIEAAFGWQIGWVTSRPRAALSKVFALVTPSLAAAAGRGIKNIFVFGHKPTFTYYYGNNTPLPTAPSGLDNFPTARDQFWAVIEQYKAVYFCGHEHIFHIEKPLGYTDNHSWQVLVGSGGSPFEAKLTDVTINPQTDRDYAWVTVNVQQSGRVTMTAYGFDYHYGTTKSLGYYTLK